MSPLTTAHQRDSAISDNLNVKRGRSWSRAWFQLGRNELVEYNQADAGARYHPNSSLAVASVASVVPIDDPTDRPFIFKLARTSLFVFLPRLTKIMISRVVTVRKEEILFAADSKMQRQDWIESLRLAALIAKKADSQLLKICIQLQDVLGVDRLQDGSAQLLPNAITIKDNSSAPHIFTSLPNPDQAVAKLKEAMEIADRGAAAQRERKSTASSPAVMALKKQGDKEFAAVEAAWRAKFKITKDSEALLACA
jgi:hypothetical protein